MQRKVKIEEGPPVPRFIVELADLQPAKYGDRLYINTGGLIWDFKDKGDKGDNHEK